MVSTPLAEILEFNREHGDLVKTAATPEEFRDRLREALRENSGEGISRRRVAARENSWENRIQGMQTLIAQTLLKKQPSPVWPWSERFLTSLQNSRRLRRGFLALAVAGGILFKTPLVWWMAGPLTLRHPLQPAEAIVVFAGGVGESGRASESYRGQVRQASLLYQSRIAPEILYLSGDTRTFEETQMMRVLTQSLGVPPEAVLTESGVSDTLEYCRRVRKNALDRGWDSVVLITSPYHARRAALTLSKMAPGLRLTLQPSRTGYYRPRWGISFRELRGIFHELAAFLYYRLRGWI
ncbi:MAG: YdcF family protein [Candidatus Omnitrophica bacterium]|nr:YdcF family protein [Candidatus Omnitrophota bacterium]